MNRRNNLHVCSTRRADGLTHRECDTYKPAYRLKTSSRSQTPAERKSSTCMCKRGRMNSGSGWYSRQTTPPPNLLSHFAVSVGSVDLMVGLGIESCSAILRLRYLVPSPPSFTASAEIHRVCFRRWVRLGCRCLCTPCCGSTRRRVFVVETADGGSVAFYATAGVSSKRGVC